MQGLIPDAVIVTKGSVRTFFPHTFCTVFGSDRTLFLYSIRTILEADRTQKRQGKRL